MLYYIHGFGSSCSSFKARKLRGIGAGCIKWSPEGLNSGKAFDAIKHIKAKDTVIGSSLGGYLALCTKSQRKILLNPAIDISGLSEYGNFSSFLTRERKRKLNLKGEIYTFIGKRDRVVTHNVNFLRRVSTELYILDDDHRFTGNFGRVLSIIKSITSKQEG